MDFMRLTLLAVLLIGEAGCATSDGLQTDTERVQEACNDTFWDRLFRDRDAEERKLVDICKAKERRRIAEERRELQREFEDRVGPQETQAD